MSRESMDRVREAYAAFNRGDREAASALLHPEIEWHAYLGLVEGRIYRGREAVMTMWGELEQGFGDTLRIEVLELVDLGDTVLAVVEGRATGPGSGVEVRQTWAQLATVRDGLIARVEPFEDREAALRAARGQR